MRRTGWQSEGLVAWTERDGPGRPPAGPNPALTTALGVGLATAFTAILFTDTLCPEHRVWVQTLATVALVGTVVAAVGLIKQWAIAPVLALLVTLCGTAIGVLDAIHSASRGRTIAAAFSLLAAGAAVVVMRQIQLVWWDRSVRRSLTSEPAPATAKGPAAPVPTDVADDDGQQRPDGAPATTPVSEEQSANADVTG